MKKYFSILLAFLLVFSLAACNPASTPPATDPEPEPVVVEPTPEPPVVSAEPEVPEEPVVVDEEVAYSAYGIQFKNKTGVAITGLYLYEKGAEDKGNSLCPELWPDAEVDKPASTIITYVVRPTDAVMELFVEWEDGTSDVLSDLTLIERDKFSMKGGVDPAGWEHEPMDDAAEIAEVDELIAAGKTTDNFYGNYISIGIEIKNKTEKEIVEWYFYEEGADYSKYNNMIDHVYVWSDETATELVPIANPWVSGKGGQYVFSHFIRPVSDYYEVYIVYSDGTTLIIPEIDMLTPNAEGFAPNELSMKSWDDPYGTVPKYDDGDPEPLQYLIDSIKSGPSADAWYPAF